MESSRLKPSRLERLRRRTGAVVVVTLLGCLLLAPACGENNGKGGSSNKSNNSKSKSSEKRMLLSSGQFNKGYQDGKRDAAAALIDANGSWMWDWVKEEEYRKGYDQGWNDGRQMKRLQDSKPEAGQQQQENKPQAQQKKLQSSRDNSQPLHKTKPTVTVSTKPKGQS